MTKILAISGGVDSMVMLDIFARQHCTSHDIETTANPTSTPDFPDHCSTNDIVVAHFDHGTRPSSKADADFVAKTAQRKYQIPAFIATAQLGENVSEEAARASRYAYLRRLAINLTPPQTAHLSPSKPGQPRTGTPIPILPIYTAHHLDDLVESIAINLLRGTGWRGLVVLDAPNIVRPFLEPSLMGTIYPWSKQDILRYAAAHQLSFRQDPTNQDDNYLRNRVRQRLANFPNIKKQKLYQLWRRQKDLKRKINAIITELLPPPGAPWQRSWFRDLEPSIALELLRAGTLRAGISATRPQLENFRQAILNYQPGTYFNLPQDYLVKINKATFML